MTIEDAPKTVYCLDCEAEAMDLCIKSHRLKGFTPPVLCSAGCGTDHRDLIDLWPMGVRVVAITEIDCGPNEPLPVGAIGRITAHCHDGRPWVSFSGSHGHTFHKPEDYIARVRER